MYYATCAAIGCIFAPRSRGRKKLDLWKNAFSFYAFCMTQKHYDDVMDTVTPYLTEDKSAVSEGEEHHVKNEDKIHESHKPQLQFEYHIYLLN